MLKRDVKIRITGQIPDDYDDKDYKILVAELNLICMKYGLRLEELEN